MYGLRFGKLLADLLFDRKSFAVGALHDAVWKWSLCIAGCRWRGIAMEGALIPTQARRALEGLRHAHPRAYGGWRRGLESEWRDDGDTEKTTGARMARARAPRMATTFCGEGRPTR